MHIQNEMALHVDYCNDFGISKEEMEATEESQGKHDSCSSNPAADKEFSLHGVYEVSSTFSNAMGDTDPR
jgi:hypothetical protein